MPPRRPKPTAASKARAARIAAALEGILDDLPPPEAEPTNTDPGTPYRPLPATPKPNQARTGIDCPGCGSPMEVTFERGVEIHRCVGCAGLWLDPGELESMVEDPGLVQADVATLRSGMKDVQVPSAPVRYRKCPRCQAVMTRRNFGSHSGVIVDECRKHGIYLDPGEFEAIETFIQLGGLALEKSRELRDAQREAHRAKMDAEHYRVMATTNPRVDHHHHHRSGSVWTELFTWLDGLFVFLLLFVQ